MTMYFRGAHKDGIFSFPLFFFSLECDALPVSDLCSPDGESKLLKGSDCSTDLLQALQCEEVVLNHNELN